MPKIVPIENQLENLSKEGYSSKAIKDLTVKYNICVNSTKEFIKNTGNNDVLVGLSGGIDSALVAKIAADALGSKHVHGAILPGPYSSQDSITDARKLADNLGIDVSTMFINSSYEAVTNSMNLASLPANKLKLKNLTRQNIQARLRMIFLMAMSNEYGWMLLNTSNKTEVYTGYSTLYGDMAGAFAPIGDIYKTDVFKICVVKNMQESRVCGKDKEVIPVSIINKPPSAELCENQSDEDSLGIDYASLDAILHEYVDNNKSLKEITFLGYPDDMVQKVIALVKKSSFKRQYEPPCAKI